MKEKEEPIQIIGKCAEATLVYKKHTQEQLDRAKITHPFLFDDNWGWRIDHINPNTHELS